MIASNRLTRARRRVPGAAPGRAVLTMSAVVLSAAGLAACSSSSAPKAGSSASASAASAAPATSAPGGTASAAAPSPSTQAGGPDVCSAVKAAQIAAITRDVVENTTRGQLGSSATCTYGLSDSVIQVQVTTAASPEGYPVFSQRVTDDAVPADSAISVPGLGEQSMASTVGVTARTAKWAVLVLNQRGTVSGQLSDDVAIAKAAIAGLG